MEPLKNPLEDRLTSLRFLRSIQYEMSRELYMKFSNKIGQNFKGERRKVFQHEDKSMVAVYPPEYLPEIERIFKELTEVKKEKRKRVVRTQSVITKIEI